MPHRKQDPKAQFEQVETLLTHWLKERRELLGKYAEIGVYLDISAPEDTLAERQSRFCELLVDYTSAGHFEVFHELLNEAECFGDGSEALAEQVMPTIGDTTEVILAYEEKYSGADADNSKLKRDLSSLGEVLESRFVLEDRLIAGLHNSHRRQLG